MEGWENVNKYVSPGTGSGRLRFRRETRALIATLAKYVEEHPELENESLGVTAKLGAAIHSRMNSLQGAIFTHQSKAKKLSAERSAALKALRKRVKDLLGELGQLLADDDQRWIAFGLDTPADRKRKRAAVRAAAAAELKSKVTALPAQGSTESKAA